MLIVLLVVSCLCMSHAHLYKNKEQVDITVNSIRPFHNPAEAYPFYALPFCLPSNQKGDDYRFGDALAGDRRQPSAYEIFFNSNDFLKIGFLKV
jgi:hypothetical protein